MSDRLKTLNSEELLGMEVEHLAALFLLDYSDMSEPDSMRGFIRSNNDANENDSQEVSKALLEAFQFLCNEGLLANNILQGQPLTDYFITRKGKEAVQYHKMEEMEKRRKTFHD